MPQLGTDVLLVRLTPAGNQTVAGKVVGVNANGTFTVINWNSGGSVQSPALNTPFWDGTGSAPAAPYCIAQP